jgi:hypothetical protein
MDAKKKKSIVIWVSVAALLGVGGYFAYTKLIKPKLDEMKAKKAAEEKAKADALAASNGSTPAPSGGSTPAPSGGSSSAPLTTEQTKSFQDWMDKYYPNWVGATNDALNNGQSLNKGGGYGNFGASTTKAFAKYGAIWSSNNSYNAALKTAQSIGAPTFVFQGKTYVTSTGLAYVAPEASGYGAIGKNAFPQTGRQYANVWKTPKTITFVGQINQPNIIGKIKNTTMADGVMWYEVDLLTPPSRSTGIVNYGQGNPYAKTGWVVANQITVK